MTTLSTRRGRGASLVVVPLLVLMLGGALGCGGKKKPKTLPPAVPNQTLYEKGLSLIAQRRFEAARKSLTEVGTRETAPPGLDSLVKIALADSYFYQPGLEHLIEAQSRYTQFVSFYPSHEMAAYAQFQIGICFLKQSPQPHLDQTYTRKAIEEFDKVARLDPRGRYVLPAEEMRESCRQKLAQHDFDVGRFYIRRRAWNGAVSRFKDILENYPSYEATDGAYYYLGYSLMKAGNDTDAEIYLQKMVREYPASRFVPDAKDALGKLKKPGGSASEISAPASSASAAQP